MAIVFRGLVTGMRAVGNPAGVGKDGKQHAAGEAWRMLSMELADGRGVYSCQLSDRDPQYKEFVDANGKLSNDLTDHKVKATVRAIVPYIREIKDESGNVLDTVPAVRIRVTNVRDEGLPSDDE